MKPRPHEVVPSGQLPGLTQSGASGDAACVVKCATFDGTLQHTLRARTRKECTEPGIRLGRRYLPYVHRLWGKVLRDASKLLPAAAAVLGFGSFSEGTGPRVEG